MKKSDRELGMNREINRRDFVSGTSIAIAGAVVAPGDVGAQGRDARLAPAASPVVDQCASQETYYPPTRTGMRGSHPGSFEVAHGMRLGETWDDPQETGEEYDLIVVGGGLSGLGAAYYFRKAMPEARVLILENHDDFGGHAQRNEHMVEGRQVISYGGTAYITGAYTYEGLELMHDIGLDAEVYRRANVGRSLLARERGLGSAVLFDEETFGEDRLVVGEPGSDEPEAWTEWLQKTPLSDRVQKDIAKLYQTQEDFFPGLSVQEKIARLRKISYQDYLLNVVGVDPDVIPFFKRRAPDANGIAGIDTMSGWAAFRYSSLPGLQGLGLGEPPPRDGFPGLENPFDDMHFPDGMAGVARLLVRWLIPGSLPGETMNDSVPTRVRYSTLDRAEKRRAHPSQQHGGKRSPRGRSGQGERGGGHVRAGRPSASRARGHLRDGLLQLGDPVSVSGAAGGPERTPAYGGAPTLRCGKRRGSRLASVRAARCGAHPLPGRLLRKCQS